MPVIRQATLSECGIACVAMVAAAFGDRTDLQALRRLHGVSMKGVNLVDLVRLCEARQLATRAVRCGISDLSRLQLPSILHWDCNHFVVLRRVSRGGLILHDPATGRRRVTFEEAGRSFTGVALEVSPGGAFAAVPSPVRLRLADLLRRGLRAPTVFVAALILAFLCELFLLASPFYMQIVIDRVVVQGDGALLDVLAAAFLLLLVFHVLTSVMRRLTFQYLSQCTVFDLSSRLMRRLLQLPLDYFRQRSLGDTQQRVQALSAIQSFVTEALPALLVDCVLVTFVIIVMAAYAPVMLALALAASALYGAWCFLVYPAMLSRQHELVRAEAKVQTHLLESLRAMQTLKMTQATALRLGEWRNLFAARVNSQIASGNLRIADSAVHHTLFQGTYIVIVYLLARDVLEGVMTIGQLSAFVAYLGMFSTRISGIVGRLFEFRLLNVPLERIADIVFHETEPADMARPERVCFGGSVWLQAVSYRHPGDSEPLFCDCTAQIVRGDFIAICGASGSGKSTLLRVIGGLLRPSSGRLLYDARPASDWSMSALRRNVGAVLQGDTLLTGSIAENIAMSAEAIDLSRVREAARQALVDEEIEALPMAYETLIGDTGSALSFSQSQRILLARALYGAPALLLLDEFTSGLDADTERQILMSLSRLNATRIVVTHSAAVMRAADQLFSLVGGRLCAEAGAQSRYAGGSSDSSCR